ncbi:MAG: hypothetical protein U0792_21380 [Gemmataceae bacterium]
MFANGLVYVSSGYFIHELMAIRPDGKGDDLHPRRLAVQEGSAERAVSRGGWWSAVHGVGSGHGNLPGRQDWRGEVDSSGCRAHTRPPLSDVDTIYASLTMGKRCCSRRRIRSTSSKRNDPRGRIQATPAAIDGSLLVRTDTARVYRLTDLEAGPQEVTRETSAPGPAALRVVVCPACG